MLRATPHLIRGRVGWAKAGPVPQAPQQPPGAPPRFSPTLIIRARLRRWPGRSIFPGQGHGRHGRGRYRRDGPASGPGAAVAKLFTRGPSECLRCCAVTAPATPHPPYGGWAQSTAPSSGCQQRSLRPAVRRTGSADDAPNADRRRPGSADSAPNAGRLGAGSADSALSADRSARKFCKLRAKRI